MRELNFGSYNFFYKRNYTIFRREKKTKSTPRCKRLTVGGIYKTKVVFSCSCLCWQSCIAAVGASTAAKAAVSLAAAAASGPAVLNFFVMLSPSQDEMARLLLAKLLPALHLLLFWLLLLLSILMLPLLELQMLLAAGI